MIECSYFKTLAERERGPVDNHPFPACRLHGVRIVERFPDDCPFNRESALAELGKRQDRAWATMAAEPSDPAGLRMLDRFNVCNQCFDAMIGNLHVRELRRQIKEQAPAVELQRAVKAADSNLPKVTIPHKQYRKLKAGCRRA